MQWLGIALAIVLVTLHLARVARPREELKLIVSVMLIGGTWETLLIGLSLLAYPSSMVIPGLAPFWLLALWASFAAQFNTTYEWLKTRIYLAALLGAVAGPLSFRAGSALGAVRFVDPWPAAATLAVGWAILLPLIVVLSRRWDGVQCQSLRHP